MVRICKSLGPSDPEPHVIRPSIYNKSIKIIQIICSIFVEFLINVRSLVASLPVAPN